MNDLMGLWARDIGMPVEAMDAVENNVVSSRRRPLTIVQLGQLYEIFLTPREAHLGTERFVLTSVDQKRRGYRVQIPAGVTQGTQFKAILGRDENRYILVRVTIHGTSS